jgi:NADPH-dependent 2,4-dienoyl-CoA reductase/sulfur reductase-like enzyme/peroxiredoxin family protein/rhodanese-related sulfurtransferase/TusA-related sulfurtransferase
MKIVVAGGVAAGASVAARARRLDEQAEIIVLERGHHVSFANCGLPYHIGGVITDRSRLLLQTPQSLRESLNIDVRTGHEVVSIDREAKTVLVREVDGGAEHTESYDALVLTPGSDPMRPPVPGIDDERIHVLRRIGDMDKIKAAVDAVVTEQAQGRRGPLHAVVVGAGYIGLEMVENLHHRGAEVTVVERADQTLPPVDHEISVGIEQHLRQRGIDVRLSTSAVAFHPRNDHVRVELTDHTVLEADLVILAAGVRPSVGLAVDAGLDLGPHGGIAVDTHMRTSDPHIWAAGDAVETPHGVLEGTSLFPLAGPANRQGRVVAENICGRPTTYTSTIGTSVVKVFDMTAGGTGATERQLIAAKMPYRAVHVHPSGHAGYYPGTASMHLKVLFDPKDGKLLGAQASGYDGVDKRLDVLATAIKLGATVFDLENVELAYAPPFGAAKDPVNMAAFVAANTIKGDLKLWYAQDFPAVTDGCRIIDVRTPEEYDIWHIPGAENVPVAQIREASQSWDRSVPLRLYCGVGFRAYLAYRALVQRGFTDVASLSGGSNTFRAWHQVTPTEHESRAVTHYAEHVDVVAAAQAAQVAAAGSGTVVELDCTGLACPGPLMKLATTVKGLAPGDEIRVRVSDPGFANDAPAWAARNGHQIVELTVDGPGVVALVRKGGAAAPAAPAAPTQQKTSFVVFSGELDKVLAAFIIANGAIAMGEEVSMFFTFWGLNALRRPDAPARDKALTDRLFSAMLPKDANHLALSQMNMLGAGPAMIKKVMKNNSVPSLPELMATAREGGVRLIACTMTMDLLGMTEPDLVEGIEFGGVATFLGEANQSGTTLFI